MKKTYHDFAQGSVAWHKHRAQYFNASDIPKIMGVCKYTSRDEFIKQIATGEVPEINPHTQRIFDKGHENERLARPIAERVFSEDLFPVTISAEIDGLLFSASFDGLNMSEERAWEHKTLNSDLARDVPNGIVDKMYVIQMEVQLNVSGAERVLFMASKDGDTDTEVHCWYQSTHGLMDEIVAACTQFKKDVDDYVPVAAVVEPTAAHVATLPAISYQLNGMAIQSNLDAYRDAAERMVEDSKLPMTTDQEFADAEVRNKALRAAVKNIKDVCDRVINEVSDIAQFRDSLSGIGEMLRQAALNGEKQVKSRKEQLRFDIISKAKVALSEHCATLEDEFGHAWLSGRVTGDFVSAAKGKSKLSSVQSAVNDELARAKIEADAISRTIRTNLKVLKEDAADFKFLFADVSQIIYKDPEDFGALVRDRVTQHKAEEERKAEKKAKDEEARAEHERAAEEQAEIDRQENDRLELLRPEKELLIEWLKKLRFIDGVYLKDEWLIGIQSRALIEIDVIAKSAINEVER